jgi:hypothetical protein
LVANFLVTSSRCMAALTGDTLPDSFYFVKYIIAVEVEWNQHLRKC